MRIRFTETFNKWFIKLKDLKAKIRITKRLERIKEDNNMGDVKSLGDSLYEIRIDYGCGYRIYFTYKNNEVIILLCGGDKSSQDKDIANAKKIIKNNEVDYDN